MKFSFPLIIEDENDWTWMDDKIWLIETLKRFEWFPMCIAGTTVKNCGIRENEKKSENDFEAYLDLNYCCLNVNSHHHMMIHRHNGHRLLLRRRVHCRHFQWYYSAIRSANLMMNHHAHDYDYYYGQSIHSCANDDVKLRVSEYECVR